MNTAGSVQAFLDAAEKKDVLGAYLLVCSRPGISDRHANAFLMRLFGTCGGCGACVSCTRVAGGHIDILRQNAPRVGDVRSAIAFLAQKPVEGRWHALVVSDADNMTESASNSLLKTLEDPPGGAVILLLARSLSGVLPTVASRCAVVHLLPEPGAAEAIAAHLRVDPARARILADLSGGFLDEAQRIQQDQRFWALREAALATTEALLWQNGTAIGPHIAFFEAHSAQIDQVLLVMLSYLRDISVLQKTGSESLLANPDRLADIRTAAAHFTTAAISNMIRTILETQQRFLFPLNQALAAEKMLFDMLKEKNRWKT